MAERFDRNDLITHDQPIHDSSKPPSTLGSHALSHRTIRFLDIYVGQPVCALLTAVRFVGLGLGARRSSSTSVVSKILFIKLIEQGATVLAYSAIKRAIAKVGRENVYFCVLSANAPILEIMDLIPEQNIIKLRDSSLPRFLWSVLGFLWKSWRLGIDCTIDCEFFSRAPAILAWLCGARTRVGLHRINSELPFRGDLLTHKVQYSPYLHVAKLYLQLVEAIDSPADELPKLKVKLSQLKVEAPKFTPRPGEKEALNQQIEDALGGPISHPCIILNPNVSDMLPLRKWPRERFFTLAQHIQREFPSCTLIFTGAPSEASDVQSICDRIGGGRIVSLAGKTSLRELVVCYTLADVHVTNDSGPGHFASMTSIYNIVMFGPETPLLFGPLGERQEVITAGLACSPCVNVINHRFSPCNNNVCMQNIPVDEVMQAITRAVKVTNHVATA